MGICASSPSKSFLVGKSGGDESARDGKTWYSKHVQREGSEVNMYFDKVVSEDYHISKKKIGSGMQGSVYEGTARGEKDSFKGEKVAIKETHIGAMNKNLAAKERSVRGVRNTLSNATSKHRPVNSGVSNELGVTTGDGKNRRERFD